MHGRLLLVALVVLLLGAVAAGAQAQSDAPAPLRLDGVSFRPELALTPNQRTRGLMQRRQAPRDGMLFVFPNAVSGPFWMKNTLVPLRIAFFDSRGQVVRRMRMIPCRRDPCELYDPGRMYRYALELPATDTRPARRLGPLRRLQRLVASAS